MCTFSLKRVGGGAIVPAMLASYGPGMAAAVGRRFGWWVSGGELAEEFTSAGFELHAFGRASARFLPAAELKRLEK